MRSVYCSSSGQLSYLLLQFRKLRLLFPPLPPLHIHVLLQAGQLLAQGICIGHGNSLRCSSLGCRIEGFLYVTCKPAHAPTVSAAPQKLHPEDLQLHASQVCNRGLDASSSSWPPWDETGFAQPMRSGLAQPCRRVAPKLSAGCSQGVSAEHGTCLPSNTRC